MGCIGFAAAILALAHPGNVDTIALPLDYYSAGELAKAISTTEVKYLPTADLSPDLYLLSLPLAPREKQIQLLCEGLGLTVEGTGQTRKLGPDPKAVKELNRLRSQVVRNLLSRTEAYLKLIGKVQAGEAPPSYPAAGDDFHSLQQQSAGTILTRPDSKVLLDLLAEAQRPSPEQFLTLEDTTSYYSKSTLSASLNKEIETVVSPQMEGVVYGFKTRDFPTGPEIYPVVLIMGHRRHLDEFRPFSLIAPGGNNRKSIVDAYLKGKVQDPVWVNPGLSEADQSLLARREEETEKAIGAFQPPDSPKSPFSTKGFSAVLGALAGGGPEGLIYKVNTHDERVVGYGSLDQVLRRGSGYTATFKDKTLIVHDELSVLPAFMTIPEVGLVEDLHRRKLGKSIFDLAQPVAISPLYAEDFDRIDERRFQIPKFTSWLEGVSIPFEVSKQDIDNLRASYIVMPLLHQLSREDMKTLAAGKEVEIKQLSDPEDYLKRCANWLAIRPMGDCSRAELDLHLSSPVFKGLYCEMAKVDDGYRFIVSVLLDNPPYLLTEFKTVMILPADDPFMKEILATAG